MGRDVAIDGRLKTRDALAAAELWATSVGSAAELATAPAPFAGTVPTGTIGSLLGRTGLDARLEDASLVVRGLLAADALADHAPALARIWSAAGRKGARGALHVVGLSGEPGFRVTADPAGAKIAALSAAEHAKLRKAPWIIDVLAAPVAPTTAGDEMAPFDEALVLARGLEPEELFRCATALTPPLPASMTVRLPKKPIDEAFVLPHLAFSTPERLARGLAETKKGAEWQRPFALLVLAVHDPAQAEPLALQALARLEPGRLASLPAPHAVEQAVRDQDLRMAAALALAARTTDAALDALLDALGAGASAGIALARARHPRTDEALLHALDPATLAAALAPTFDACSRAAELLFAIGQRRVTAAEPTLCSAWASRRDTPGVLALGAALAALDKPSAHAAVAEALGAADPALARLAARSLLRLDASLDEARPHLAEERRARALFEALADEPSWIDAAWRAAAAGYPGSGFAKAAADRVAAR